MKDNFDFDIMLNMIRDGENFSYSRFGDGEWSAILQNRKTGAFNCDGHQFFPEMGRRLKNIIESKPQYWIGMQNLAKEQNEHDSEFQRLYQINDWTDNEVLTRASIRGNLEQFFGVLKMVRVAQNQAIILVGNKSLKNQDKFHVTTFIEVAPQNCWLQYKEINEKVGRAIHAVHKSNPIILYCASMMSNVLIDDMYKLHYNTITQIDCGSVFDPYVGKLSRSYMKKLKL